MFKAISPEIRGNYMNKEDIDIIVNEVTKRITNESNELDPIIEVLKEKLPFFGYKKNIYINPIERYFEISSLIPKVTRMRERSTHLGSLAHELKWIDNTIMKYPPELELVHNKAMSSLNRVTLDKFKDFSKIICNELIVFEAKLMSLKEKIINNIGKNLEIFNLKPFETEIIQLLIRKGTLINEQENYGMRSIHSSKERFTIGSLIEILSSSYSESMLRKCLEPDSNLIANDYIKVHLSSLSKNWDSTVVSINKSKFNKKKSTQFKGIGSEELIEPIATFKSLNIDPKLKNNLVKLLQVYKSGKIKSLSFLFHGKSGSGKTSLAHAIADYLNFKVVLIRDFMIGKELLPSVIQFLIRKNKNRKVILLFDECESLWFENSSIYYMNGKPKNSEIAWSKQILENMEGLVAFTSNEKPPATFVRRVDFVSELNTPAKDIRLKILRSILIKESRKLKIKNRVSLKDLEQISLKYELTAGFLKKAVLLSLAYSSDHLTVESIEKALNDINWTVNGYETDMNNNERNIVLDKAQIDIIEKIKAILRANEEQVVDPLLPKSISLLLYGPPGTGKTEYAREIANSLNKKLHMTSASNFLSMWVGGTEANISSTFRKCAENGDVLFIDEVEGLFLSRDNASKSWELTQVNEFLKQIEIFKGILIVATNMKEKLDPAFSRRFLIHVPFEYPKQETREKILKRFTGNILKNSEIIDISKKYIFSPGEVRNAAALWKFEANQNKETICNLIEQQISFRIDKNDQRTISIH